MATLRPSAPCHIPRPSTDCPCLSQVYDAGVMPRQRTWQAKQLKGDLMIEKRCESIRPSQRLVIEFVLCRMQIAMPFTLRFHTSQEKAWWQEAPREGSHGCHRCHDLVDESGNRMEVAGEAIAGRNNEVHVFSEVVAEMPIDARFLVVDKMLANQIVLDIWNNDLSSSSTLVDFGTLVACPWNVQFRCLASYAGVVETDLQRIEQGGLRKTPQSRMVRIFRERRRQSLLNILQHLLIIARLQVDWLPSLWNIPNFHPAVGHPSVIAHPPWFKDGVRVYLTANAAHLDIAFAWVQKLYGLK